MSLEEFMKSQEKFHKQFEHLTRPSKFVTDINKQFRLIEKLIPKQPAILEFSKISAYQEYFSAFNRLEKLINPNHLKFIKDLQATSKGFAYYNYDLAESIDGFDENTEENDVQTVVFTETSKIKQLITDIYNDNDELYNIHPRDFEKVIAELLTSRGFDVELTKQTRDGGYDLIALKYLDDISPLKFIVECKKWAQHRKVDVDVIRSFMYVMSKNFANKGMIFTTSYFTKDAKDEQEKGALLLDYKDKDEVINWVNKYRNK